MTGTSSKVLANRKAEDPHANRLLGLLSPRDYERLRPHLHGIALKYRQSLYRAHKPIEFVYFIETGVGSLVNTMANGPLEPGRKRLSAPGRRRTRRRHPREMTIFAARVTRNTSGS